MHPRRSKAGVAALAAALLPLVGAACGGSARPPHVVLIVIDTQRADRLGVYGYERDTSPHIDALARHSLVFTNASSTAPWTNPAVAALFTGLHPGALGIESRPVALPETIPTLPETLRAAGYRTHGVISHLYIGDKFGFGRGFDTWNQENAQGHTHVSSESLTDLALERLAEEDGRRPFFLFVHYFDPHYDYLEHEGHVFSADYQGPLRSGNDNIRNLRAQAAAGEFSAADVRHLNDLYDSEVAFTDEHVGRLLDELERRGLYDQTLVVLTADHGESLCERPDGWIGHGRFLHQEILRVPLLVKPPGSRSARVVGASVSTVDLLPTIVDLAGAAGGPEPARRSLLRDLGERPAFGETRYVEHLQSVTRGRWKLVRDTRTGARRLFDLEADPGERRDVAESRADVAAELEALRARWSARNEALLRLVSIETPEMSPAELEQLRRLGYTHTR